MHAPLEIVSFLFLWQAQQRVKHFKMFSRPLAMQQLQTSFSSFLCFLIAFLPQQQRSAQ